MGFIIGLLYIIFTISAILLILMVLFRPTEGSGLSGAFGGMGGDTAFGVKATQVIDKAVMIVAGTFIVLAVILAVLKKQYSKTGGEDDSTSRIVAPYEPGNHDA
ncbi:MAG: preprotein translocase subunit SecG [Planctomycetota bacterium]